MNSYYFGNSSIPLLILLFLDGFNIHRSHFKGNGVRNQQGMTNRALNFLQLTNSSRVQIKTLVVLSGWSKIKLRLLELLKNKAQTVYLKPTINSQTKKLLWTQELWFYDSYYSSLSFVTQKPWFWKLYWDCDMIDS